MQPRGPDSRIFLNKTAEEVRLFKDRRNVLLGISRSYRIDFVTNEV